MADFFSVGQNDIGYLGPKFLEKASKLSVSLVVPPTLTIKRIDQEMNSKEVITRFKPKGLTLNEVSHLMQTDGRLKNGRGNLFNVRDGLKTYVLGVLWHKQQWRLVSPPEEVRWSTNCQVFC